MLDPAARVLRCRRGRCRSRAAGSQCQSVCVGGKAFGDAKGVGTADNAGVVYIVSRSGTEIYRTESRRTGPFQTRVFTGPGNYLFCAKNAVDRRRRLTTCPG